MEESRTPDFELDTEAWARWTVYRKLIRKPINPKTEHHMQAKLIRLGGKKDQAKIVDQSIDNQWQGLFELKQVTKSEKPARTPEQDDAARARLERLEHASERAWMGTVDQGDPITMLRLADALVARYSVLQGPDRPDIHDRMVWIKGRVAELVKAAPFADILKHPDLVSLVRQLFGENGVRRLRNEPPLPV